jgi:hypothetical protein
MTVDYHSWYATARTDLERMIRERLEFEREIENRDRQIAALKQTIKALAPLAGEEVPEIALDPELAAGGMTDCVRAILSKATEPLTASEIRESLESLGFDMKSYSNPLATIHTVLRRLTESGEVESTHEMPAVKKFTIPVSKHLAVEKIAGKAFAIGKFKGFVGVGRLRRRSLTTEEPEPKGKKRSERSEK